MTSSLSPKVLQLNHWLILSILSPWQRDQIWQCYVSSLILSDITVGTILYRLQVFQYLPQYKIIMVRDLSKVHYQKQPIYFI